MLAHYERHLGPLLDVEAVHRGVRVLRFESPYDDEEVVLATDGARTADGPGAERGIELVMLCRIADAKGAATVLCDLAHYGPEHRTSLSWFQTLPLGVGLVPGSTLTSLLLTMPWFGKSEFFTADIEGRRVDIVHVIPITEQERELSKSSGVEELERALEDAETDLTDLGRASAVWIVKDRGA